MGNSYELKELLRQKRYLVYPNPLGSETKVQVLFGLGLPMESEVSVILGYVLKCNYNLPYNSSSFTEPYVRYQRDTDRNGNKNENKSNRKSFRIKSEESLSRWDLYRILESALETLGSPGKVCLLRAVCEAAELPFDPSHGLLGELLHALLTPSSTSEYSDLYDDREYLAAEHIGKNRINKHFISLHLQTYKHLFIYRHLIAGLGLPMDVDVSTIIGYVIKFNYNLPFNASDLTEPYIRYQRSTSNHQYPEGFTSRWEIYRMIESTLVGFSSGRSCLLRVICEAAALPFSRSQGILPQLIHILLTPSSTNEKYIDNTDQEFHAAELEGKKNPGDCHRIFSDCCENILDYFTDVIN
ncbi:uncharacterized protein LOC103575299 [Microplitis demolitor]|uniref:uncharacterized protein LOC103575299 n=1 Tax=Microplitis demolitor TaxID=69319 RepID=UPI00235B6DEE|nr:uncharacterized protein LOC103575299 [Microplitis demolitor]